MKRLSIKIIIPFMLILSTVFGNLSILNTSPVFALPGDDTTIDTDTTIINTDITTPENTNLNDETTSTIDDPSTSSDINTETPSNSDTDTTISDAENEESEDPDTSENNEDEDSEEDEEETETCSDVVGSLSWIVCSATQLISSIVDNIYDLINNFLVVEPLTMNDASPIYRIWQYIRTLTNIVFAICITIVLFSQITGLGISNYGIKRVLPRLIIAAILVNLSFLICSLAVDVSNILGASLREFFSKLQADMLTSIPSIPELGDISFSAIAGALVSGGAILSVLVAFGGGIGQLLFMFLAVALGAVVAVVSGLLTLAGRQALVALLVMASPIAFVLYLLPNTEKWFTQWKQLLTRMLVFYPLFSFLYGASQLVGAALIASATNGYGVILGLGVQVFPLFFSWSLMKMSGTILNSINTGIRRVAAPLQAVGTRWAMENAERRRQNFISQSNHTSAHLRRFLDGRRELRLADTRNAAEIRHDRAISYASNKMSSITGRDENGNTTWRTNPNKYTRTAKSASYYHTLASNSNAALQNTLTAYGRHFEGIHAQHLSNSHAEAFLDSMAQQFLATNEAQADQEWLLNRYLDAKTTAHLNPYQYNRLVRDAAGGLGHNGESSIMGQVIIGNSNIESRRRTEGRVIINKFGMEKHKQELRAMIFDKEYINDEGFATDENGIQIEDDQYNLLDGKHYTPWQRYIAVHKVTKKEITKEQYDNLSDFEKDNYKKVRYFDITNDRNEQVQRVFEDDAGYMKEILSDDVYISDPIVRRFATQIGLAKNDKEKDGILRTYHSTIRAAIDSSGFKDHGAAYSQMYTSAANAGLIRGMGHHNIILLQSFSASAKPGSFFKNDKFFIEEMNTLLNTAAHPESFSKYFSDQDILSATDNNGKPLKGIQISYKNGEPEWEEINGRKLEQEYTDEEIIELRKNYIKHKMIPKAIQTAVGFLNRKMSPEASNSLKPGAKDALDKMTQNLAAINSLNLDPSIPFTERPDGNTDLFKAPDTNSMMNTIKATQEYSRRTYGTSSAVPITPNTIHNISSPVVQSFADSIKRSQEANARIVRHNDITDILETFREYYENAKNSLGFEVFCSDILSLFEERPILREYLADCDMIIANYRLEARPTQDNFINQITDYSDERELELIERLHQDIESLIYRIVNAN